MKRLFVVGDSFSWTPEENHGKTWIGLLAERLNTTVINISAPGVPQDWIWNEIANLSRTITSEDQLIVVLTDPARFWFIESAPTLSNSWIAEEDFERIIENKEVKKAIEYYIRYIQRPSLDIQFLAHRLGWLNNLVKVKNLKKPLVILAFEQYIPDKQNYSDLIFSKGDLCSVSRGEETPSDPHVWNGIDVRYNHLTLSNHIILTNKIVNTLKNGEDLDLTSGFNTQVMNSSSIKDENFIDQELSRTNVSLYKSKPSKAPSSPSSRFFNR